jgi:hypothetical protein
MTRRDHDDARLELCLEMFGYLNEGCDHVPDYGLCRLSDGGTLQEALGAHFGSLYTSHSQPQPAANWAIRVAPPASDWAQIIACAVSHWFFDQRFSPAVSHESVKNSIVERFVALVREELGEPTVQEVFVTPPMFYDLVWQDFVLATDRGRWLLHLGFAD